MATHARATYQEPLHSPGERKRQIIGGTKSRVNAQQTCFHKYLYKHFQGIMCLAAELAGNYQQSTTDCKTSQHGSSHNAAIRVAHP